MAEVIKLADGDTIAEAVAARWVEIAQAAISERGSFSVALAGGSTPRRLYEVMASDYGDGSFWQHTHIFWGDERRGDGGSNYRMASESLLEHVAVPKEQIHRMDEGGLSGSAARAYDDQMWRYFRYGRGEWPQFDLILLGMGADGHFASIFPGTRAMSDLSHKVIVYEVHQLGVERMTLTLPTINQARQIIFMVTGEAKAEALNESLNGDYKPSTYPIQAIKPVDGDVVFYVDEAAGSGLG